jgi:biopolymer transport protein ExbB
MFEEYLEAPFIALQDFMYAGGPVLWAILVVAIVMWAFILERLSYFRLVLPDRVKQTAASWNARSDHSSWHAHKIRRAMISEVRNDASQYLLLIKTLIAVCPLLGLVGTVTGMVHVFDVMAVTGTGNARGMAEGISRATIPTMSGLVVALSGLIVMARLEAKAKTERQKLADCMAL